MKIPNIVLSCTSSKGQLGLQLGIIEDAGEFGAAVVVGVLAAGRAEVAGVLKKDRLLKVNGKEVIAQTITDVLANPGTYPATVTIMRGGVTLGKTRKDGLPNRIEFACLRHYAMLKFEKDSKRAEKGKSSTGDDDTAKQLATLGFQWSRMMSEDLNVML